MTERTVFICESIKTLNGTCRCTMNRTEKIMSEKETVTIEKKVYDVILKNNARLIEENENLRGALEAILDATQKEKVSIPVLRFVAYTALKGC